MSFEVEYSKEYCHEHNEVEVRKDICAYCVLEKELQAKDERITEMEKELLSNESTFKGMMDVAVERNIKITKLFQELKDKTEALECIHGYTMAITEEVLAKYRSEE